jgi:hypothetical protein
MSYALDRVGLLLPLLWLGCIAAGTGCATKAPLQVSLTQIAPYQHAAKPPDCAIPVLESEPMARFRQVAIVEAWADIKDTDTDVLPALRRKACETGADALLIVNSRHQDPKNLLYAPTPNETQNQVDSATGYDTKTYIATMEHTRRLGEAGHSGYYVDAIAIDYVNKDTDGQAASGKP